MRPPSLPPVSDNARRSGWKWIAAGIACVFSPFSLPMLWELMNPILARSLPRVWLGLEFAAFWLSHCGLFAALSSSTAGA
jgi:hypothetical protein